MSKLFVGLVGIEEIFLEPITYIRDQFRKAYKKNYQKIQNERIWLKIEVALIDENIKESHLK